MTEIEWFIYGFFAGFLAHPLYIIIEKVIEEAKIAKRDWRK